MVSLLRTMISVRRRKRRESEFPPTEESGLQNPPTRDTPIKESGLQNPPTKRKPSYKRYTHSVFSNPLTSLVRG